MFLMAASTGRSGCQALCRQSACCPCVSISGEEVRNLDFWADSTRLDPRECTLSLCRSLHPGRCQEWDDLPGLLLLKRGIRPAQAFAICAAVAKHNTSSSYWFFSSNHRPLFELQSITSVLFATCKQGEQFCCWLPRMMLCSVKRPRREMFSIVPLRRTKNLHAPMKATSVMVS